MGLNRIAAFCNPFRVSLNNIKMASKVVVTHEFGESVLDFFIAEALKKLGYGGQRHNYSWKIRLLPHITLYCQAMSLSCYPRQATGSGMSLCYASLQYT